MEFRWNEWNVAHTGQHDVTPLEVEWVVRNARAPFPAVREDGKWAV